MRALIQSLNPYSTSFFFFFNDTATTEIYTLSLHDALPISSRRARPPSRAPRRWPPARSRRWRRPRSGRSRTRSEEHTSELQSRLHLVCRLLLEKKKNSLSRRLLYNYRAARLRHARHHHNDG